MTVREFLNNIGNIIRGNKVTTHNPELLTFVNDEEALVYTYAEMNKLFYCGNSQQLLAFFTDFAIRGWWHNPISNRNFRNYFWALSSAECNIKRIHSGLPKVIVDKLSDILDIPAIDGKVGDLQKILDYNNWNFILKQKSRPMSLAQGWGAYKVDIAETHKYPIIEYFEAKNVRYYLDNYNVITGISFLSYFNNNDKKYVLFETRRVIDNKSTIEYAIFELMRDGYNMKPAKYEDAGLNPKDYETKAWNTNILLATPSRYYYDVLNGNNYGRSIFDGKTDLIDDLDESLSIASRTARLSTPVEYIDPEMMEKDRNGNPILPARWNREYVKKEGGVDSDGDLVNSGIICTQPKLNFNEYDTRSISIATNIMEGIISPSSMGKELSRKDNAEAQREKEKVTLTTRLHIIEQETSILRNLYNVCLVMNDIKNNKPIKDYSDKIKLKYNEFGTPAFEEQLHSLGEALVLGAISPTEYVERIYRDNKTEEWKKSEIAYITKRMEAKDFVYNGKADTSANSGDVDGNLEKSSK